MRGSRSSAHLCRGKQQHSYYLFDCHYTQHPSFLAQDALIALVDPSLLYDNIKQSFLAGIKEAKSLDEEKKFAIELLHRICPGTEHSLVQKFFSYFRRETYNKGDILWKQGTNSNCAKLLLSGDLMASLENEAGTTEPISVGNLIGESGLVGDDSRNSTVVCLTDAILYSLSREAWEDMKENNPEVPHLLYAGTIRYLSMRIHHVSNRIFETRCLPI